MGFVYVNYKWNQKIARTAEGRGQKEGGRRVSKVGAVRAPLSHLEDSSTLDLHFSTFLRQQGHKASTRPAPASWSKVRKRICGRTEPRHAQLFVALHDLGLGFRLFITRTCVVWALRALALY